MEIEIAKISCIRIRQATSDCYHYLPRKKWLPGYHDDIFEKFKTITFSSGKFCARINYIFHPYPVHVWAERSIIYMTAKNCTDPKIYDYLSAEYSNEIKKMMEDVDYYHFGHIMSKIDDPKIAKVIIDNMEKLPEDFEVDEFNGIDKEILFQIIEKFPELYCNEEKLFKLMPDNEDFAKLFIQRHPGKYKYERFLEEIIKYHFGNTYNYCFDLFKTEPSIPQS